MFGWHPALSNWQTHFSYPQNTNCLSEHLCKLFRNWRTARSWNLFREGRTRHFVSSTSTFSFWTFPFKSCPCLCWIPSLPLRCFYLFVLLYSLLWFFHFIIPFFHFFIICKGLKPAGRNILTAEKWICIFQYLAWFFIKTANHWQSRITLSHRAGTSQCIVHLFDHMLAFP